jgi:hypothetical protein
MVMAPVEHRPAAPADPVDRTRQAGGDALHAVCEGFLPARFDWSE